MRVLIVEDDPLIGDAIRRSLASGGFAADLVGTAAAARSALHAETFDLLMCDIGLPQEDGLQLVHSLRKQGAPIPILMLTARDGLAERVDALDIGADDYLTKPFQIPELLARTRALIRRSKAITSSELTLGPLRLELAHKRATAAGKALELTHREWSILECLMLSAGRIVSKERLMSAISGWDEEITPNAIEVYVSRLRNKLGDAAQVRAVRGMGYRIDEPKQRGG